MKPFIMLTGKAQREQGISLSRPNHHIFRAWNDGITGIFQAPGI